MNNGTPKIVGFCCKSAFNGDKDLVGRARASYEPSVRIVALPCSSKVDTLAIIKAFEAGADGVFVLGCKAGQCRLMDGTSRASRTISHAKDLLKEIGIDGERLEKFDYGAQGFQNFNQVAEAMSQKIRSLGTAG